MTSLKKALFALLTVLGGLLLLDVALHFMNVGDPEDKTWIETVNGYGNCFPTDTRGHFPFSIRDSIDDRRRLRKLVRNCYPHPLLAEVLGQKIDFEFLVEKTPHCIVYDPAKRRRGFFSERRKWVAVVGDSFAFGEGVKEKETLAYYLGLRYPRYNFRNFGKPGANIATIQSLTVTLLEADPSPQSLLYFYNLNDAFFLGEMEPDMPNVGLLNKMGQEPAGSNTSFWGWLSSASSTIRLVRKAYMKNERTQKVVSNFVRRYADPSEQDKLDVSIRHLLKMKQVANAKGVKLRVVIYPLLHKDMWGGYPFASIHRRMMQICAKHKIVCVDAYPAFSDHRSLAKFRVHPTDSHPNGLANRTVVDYLAGANRLLFDD